jgi:hypothetical protein
LSLGTVPFDSPAQFSERPREVGGLVVRVQAARVRKHPQQRPSHVFGLTADRRGRSIEGDAVGADADHGNGARPIAAHRPFEPLPAGTQLVVAELVRACGGARLVIPTPHASSSPHCRGSSLVGVKPAAASAGQNRLPGRAK